MKKKTNPDLCDCSVIHQDVVDRAAKAMPDPAVLENLAAFFKVCGDPTRIKILHALSVSEMCVCDIAALLGMTLSSISHQLRVLRQARLVASRKDGQMVFYSLADRHVKQILGQGLRHAVE